MKKIFFLVSAAFFLTVCLTGCFEKLHNSLKALGKPKYMVVDLITGGVSYMDIEPAGGWSDIYKTTKLVLRRIEPGTFVMGSPDSELGRLKDEVQHKVTLTRPFYIGVFEITQKQYQLVTGRNPSEKEFMGDTKPVDNVSYNEIRGMQKGAKWPADSEVDEYSFLGKLRARIKMKFDLPTEAQWEYACRAGTTTALNNGTNLSNKESDYNLDKLGRYINNGGWDGLRKIGHAFVGSYVPNFWDLYDMHGNVCEWCLDWRGEYTAEPATDPAGPDSGVYRVVRGGCFSSSAFCCRSSYRDDDGDCRSLFDNTPSPNNADFNYGFRVVLMQ